MDVEIRQVEKSDIREILDIEQSSFSTPWVTSFFEEELNLPISRAYRARLGREDRKLVGYIINRCILDELHILNIAVHEGFRRRDIATQLFKHSLEQNPQVRTAHLEVRERNGGARAFYRKMGFIEIGRCRRYYSDTGEDAIAMAWLS